MSYVDVYYVDVLEGGSGLTRIKLYDLPIWLVERPGFLVRAVEPISDLETCNSYQKAKDAARRNLCSKF